MEEAARAIGSSGPLGAPRWEQDGQNDLGVAAWRAGGRDSGITAQPDWGDGLLTAPRRRRRGPNEEPPRGTEQFGAMWPWCSPVGLEEEELAELPPLEAGGGGVPEPRAQEAPGSRATFLNRAVLERHGATPGCPGCLGVLKKGPPRG